MKRQFAEAAASANAALAAMKRARAARGLAAAPFKGFRVKSTCGPAGPKRGARLLREW